MLGTEVDRERSEPALEFVRRRPLTMCTSVAGSAERSRSTERISGVGPADRDGAELAERPVVVEQDSARPRTREAAQETLEYLALDLRRWLPSAICRENRPRA